jgi:hypothetical protein
VLFSLFEIILILGWLIVVQNEKKI